MCAAYVTSLVTELYPVGYDNWPASTHSNSALLRSSIKQSIQSLPMSYWPQGCLPRQPGKEHEHPRDGLGVNKKDTVTGHKHHKPLSPTATVGQFLLAHWFTHYGQRCDGWSDFLHLAQRPHVPPSSHCISVV